MSLAQKPAKSKKVIAPKARQPAPAKSAKVQPAVALKALAAARKTASTKAAASAVPKAEAEKKVVSTPVVSTPVVAAPVVAAPVASEPVAAAPAPVKAAPPPRKIEKPVKAAPSKRNGFSALEYIVYPAHGVGQIIAVEEQEVAGFKLELFVISFIKDKMILKVPVPKVASVGMRKLSDEPVVKRALDTLTGRARVKRTMWSRRAQEYEAKINSGDLIAIAEVVRDLYRSEAQPEQSYSERQLYEAALDRIAREIGTVMQLTETEALKLIEANLQKGPRRTRADEAEADEGGVEDEAA